jgi:hypothetical protein
MATVVNALRALNVPVALVADFDVLNAEQPLRGIIEALGGDWNHYLADFNVLTAAINALSSVPQKATLRDGVDAVLGTMPEGPVSKKDVERLRGVIRGSSGWDQVKRSGVDGVPQGSPSVACRQLLRALAEIGLFVVEAGEVERFVPTVAHKGPEWVIEVLEQGLHRQAPLAYEMLSRVALFIANSVAASPTGSTIPGGIE